MGGYPNYANSPGGIQLDVTHPPIHKGVFKILKILVGGLVYVDGGPVTWGCAGGLRE